MVKGRIRIVEVIIKKDNLGGLNEESCWPTYCGSDNHGKFDYCK